MQLQQWDAALQSCDNAVRRAGREQEAQQLHQKAKRLKHKSEQKDYYGVLGLPNVPKGQPGAATDKQIKKAYHKLSMKHHPDKATGEEAKKEAEQKVHTVVFACVAVHNYRQQLTQLCYAWS